MKFSWWDVFDPFHIIVPVRPGEAQGAFKLGTLFGQWTRGKMVAPATAPQTINRVAPKKAEPGASPAVNGIPRKGAFPIGLLLVAVAVVFLMRRK